jgi:hypothetical protein
LGGAHAFVEKAEAFFLVRPERLQEKAVDSHRLRRRRLVCARTAAEEGQIMTPKKCLVRSGWVREADKEPWERLQARQVGVSLL